MADFQSYFYPIKYKQVFWAIVIILALVMPILSFDYGIVEDAEIHNRHGKIILDYFLGKDSLATMSPFTEKGEVINNLMGLPDRKLMPGMNMFGGFFDLLTAFAHHLFPSAGEYETRNLFNSLFGLLLFLFVGLLAKELGNWKTGVLALIFISLTPLLFGHSMNNPKDIPFAAFYTFSLYHIVKLLKELPEIKLKRSALLVLNISLLINIRAMGLVMIAFLFLATFIWWLVKNNKTQFKEINYRETYILAIQVFVIGFAAYISAAVFWPYAQTNPLTVPLDVFFKTKDFSLFHTYQRFEGHWVDNFLIPWYFIPKWLIITIPLHIFPGIVFAGLLYFRRFFAKTISFSLLRVSFILFASLFPVIFAIANGSSAYDNARHFLFVIPPLVAVCALSWNYLFSIIKKTIIKVGLLLVLVVILFDPLHFTITNHPLEALYFSPLVGGMDGAFKNYETDYWGFTVKPAIKWLENNTPEYTHEKPARVRLYYGNSLKASYYLDKSMNLKFVKADYVDGNWDFSIVMFAEAKHFPDRLVHWPPPNTVYEEKVDNVCVCAVIKNTFRSVEESLKEKEKALAANPNVNGYIDLSVIYYNAKQYNKSIEASKNVLQLDPNNSSAYNNLCSAYNCLEMFDEAKAACIKALAINPDFTLAKNNLKVAEDGISRRKAKKLSIGQYLNLSYNYYVQGNYNACIKTCRELLSIDPTNSTAYNNICSSYNALGQYKEAEKACTQALNIKPDYELAKNNLKIARDNISKKQ